MPKCHKNYPNCIWKVPSEWHTLCFYSALLTKVYWIYATHNVRVCVNSISRQTSKLDFNDRSNLQVHFDSEALASLYDLLRYHSLKSTDPFLKNYSLIFLHVFTPISLISLLTNTPRLKNQFFQMIHLFLHTTLMIRPTFLR